MPRILAITGGVGGAKLALGLASLLGPDDVAFAVNTGDDFEHLGFEIAPDLDTLTYTLAGLANPELGWGRADETWHFMSGPRGAGRRNLVPPGRQGSGHARHPHPHARRRRDAHRGDRPSGAVAGRRHRILPMSDDPVRTTVQTPGGALPFQHYFVRDRCAPAVTGFEFVGSERARPNPAILDWLEAPMAW
jgi:LPPG:FO 2-phospho-L-lactate transferase